MHPGPVGVSRLPNTHLVYNEYPIPMRLNCYTQGRDLDLKYAAQAAAAAVALALALTPASFAQSPGALPPIKDLVRRVVDNELAAKNSKTHRFMFRSHRETLNVNQDKLYVETRDAMAGMVTAWDNKPLTPESRKGEQERLDRLLNDPEELRHKEKQERENGERIERIIKAMPDAFLYEYDGVEMGSPTVGRTGMQLLRVKFRPNPDYSPPSKIELVLTGMEGTILVDSKSARFARIDGTLFRDVGFGWGILGHLDKGGSLRAEQSEYSSGVWVPSLMSMRFTGKILLFKTLNFKSEESFRDFRPVPVDLTFAQGIEMLKKENGSLAENVPVKNSQ